MNENYGDRIKAYRMMVGKTQNEIATEMNVTPGYISNVENGRTAMSLRFLIYYAKIMGVTLDKLVGDLEPEYKSDYLDNELMDEILKLKKKKKEKLLKTIKLWNE